MSNPLLEDFETYFASLNLLTVGSMYKDFLPEQPDSAVVLYEYSGESAIPQAGAVGIRSIQVVSRDIKAGAARDTCQSLYNALITDDGIISLTASRWGSLDLKQPPFKLKVDEVGRTLYCFNLRITTYLD